MAQTQSQTTMQYVLEFFTANAKELRKRRGVNNTDAQAPIKKQRFSLEICFREFRIQRNFNILISHLEKSRSVRDQGTFKQSQLYCCK